jgi:hypothetical protein
VLPFFEDDDDCAYDHEESDDVVPFQFLFEVGDGEDGKDNERDYFLYGLELGGGKLVVADAVGGHLKAVFDKCDEPTDDDGVQEGAVLELQMTVPREGHEYVGDRKQNNGFHTEKAPEKAD